RVLAHRGEASIRFDPVILPREHAEDASADDHLDPDLGRRVTGDLRRLLRLDLEGERRGASARLAQDVERPGVVGVEVEVGFGAEAARAKQGELSEVT